jgi:hypothetical protein
LYKYDSFIKNNLRLLIIVFIKLSEDIITAHFFMNFQKKMVFTTYHVIEAKKRYDVLSFYVLQKAR